MPLAALCTSAAAVIFAISACGVEDETSVPAVPGNPEAAVVVAALGDSITAGSPLWDPDPEVRATIAAPDERSQFEYWAARRNPGHEFRNCGVFGERTDEIATRLEACAEGADVLVVQGGINDIAQGRPVEMAAESLRGMVRAGEDAGLEVLLADVLPWNNGHPSADGPIAELNRLIETVGREEGVEVLAFHDTLEDPAAAGVMAEAWTGDGDHPSVEGYRRLGELFTPRRLGEAPEG